MLKERELTNQIIGAAIEVHREHGPGLLEAIYEESLCIELGIRGIEFTRQLELPVFYKGQRHECGFRSDVIAEQKVLIELKAIGQLHPIHEAQLITYLKITKISVGLLINFNLPVLKDGIIRRVV